MPQSGVFVKNNKKNENLPTTLKLHFLFLNWQIIISKVELHPVQTAQTLHTYLCIKAQKN